MPATQSLEAAPRKPLRLWPGVVAVTLQWLLWFVVPVFLEPGAGMWAGIGAFALALVLIVWWLFFSRAPWVDRIGAFVFMVVAVIATKRVVDESIAGGMMGFLLPVYSVLTLSLALVAAAVIGRSLSSGRRRLVMAGAIVLACGVFTLMRTGGILGDGGSEFHWRWTKTPEQRLLAQAVNDKDLPAAPAPVAPPSTVAGTSTDKPSISASDASATTTAIEWSGFRGPARDNVVRGVRIDTDWTKSAPVELWRKPIGPGWSSFAVHGDFIFTQEQRGEEEIVSCYRLSTGAPVWMHRDAVRFYESNGGAGPRGTPAVSDGRVYAFGATGIVNALDARDGSVIWSRNAASDTKAKIPGWGFASSPLVVGDEVVVATSGVMAAYDAATGKPRWIGPAGRGGYSSPQLATIDGVPQILLLNGDGATSVAPADGAVLWQHEWPGDGIVQPAIVAGNDILIGSGSGLNNGIGVRRVSVTHAGGTWRAEERWTSQGLKPYYNDFVVHKDHAYGFDGSILSCIDLADGTRKWKGGRYGHGQMIVLPDQDVLLVLSEEGELALVAASPDKFTELARIPAIEGKTWNHPVLAGDIVLVRNGEEMAAYRLKTQR